MPQAKHRGVRDGPPRAAEQMALRLILVWRRITQKDQVPMAGGVDDAATVLLQTRMVLPSDWERGVRQEGYQAFEMRKGQRL